MSNFGSCLAVENISLIKLFPKFMHGFFLFSLDYLSSRSLFGSLLIQIWAMSTYSRGKILQT